MSDVRMNAPAKPLRAHCPVPPGQPDVAVLAAATFAARVFARSWPRGLI
jgi:hypothetical protein